jgi:dimethylamine monooxygenase subunit A
MIRPEDFPFSKPQYELRIGAGPILPPRTVIERDALYEQEIALKQACLRYDTRYYVQALPGTEPAQNEANAYIGLPGLSLLEAGNQVQEDLLLLDAKQPELPLIAGHLCFANGWCLDEKLGKPFLEIHGPVPQFGESIGPASARLLHRITPDRPIVRINWSIKPTGQLDLSSRWNTWLAAQAQAITPQNAGQQCWMRIERQTLSKLPQTNTVLFTLHTYTQPMASLSEHHQRIMKGILETCPAEMLAYKGMAPFAETLMKYLASQ